ncbi:MAG: ABC transporter permease [Saccharospirillaceae bacterium]|nr:ABC transporter permease [Pseudomonadales bacterium]NRB79249.1 ABC transporter permease [Saccharospirillaceae bacterium]
MLMWILALRNLRRNVRRSILTGLSMMGGYLLLAVTLSLQDGTYHVVLENITKTKSGHFQIVQNEYLEHAKLDRTVELNAALITSIQNNKNIIAYTTRIDSAALAYADEKTSTVFILGIDPQKEKAFLDYSKEVVKGEYFSDLFTQDGYAQVMIGASVAKKLDLSVGGELILIGQGVDGSTANDIYIVTAIVGSKNDSFANQVIMPLVHAQEFLTLYNQAHHVLLLTDNYRVAQQNLTELNTTLVLPDESQLVSWQTIEQEFYDAMTADKQGSNITILVVVLMVGIGVLNTILMSTMERRGEFGLLIAMGTQPLRLFLLILFEVFLLVCLACLTALIIVFPLNLWFSASGFELSTPIEMSGINMTHMKGINEAYVYWVPAVILILTSMVIAIFPALKAAKTLPAVALKGL